MDIKDRRLEIDQNVPLIADVAFSLCTVDLPILHLISADFPGIRGTLGQPLGSLSRGRGDHSWLLSIRFPKRGHRKREAEEKIHLAQWISLGEFCPQGALGAVWKQFC